MRRKPLKAILAQLEADLRECEGPKPRSVSKQDANFAQAGHRFSRTRSKVELGLQHASKSLLIEGLYEHVVACVVTLRELEAC